MDSLAVTDLTFAPLVVQKFGVDRHKLSLEEPSQLRSDFLPAHREVNSLRHVCRRDELELDLGVAKRAHVLLEARQELDFFPRFTNLFMLVSLSFVSVGDLLAHVD